MEGSRLAFSGVTKRFLRKGREPPLTAVRDVTLAVGDTEVVSLIGPSGCGKSTLLTMGAGLDRPCEGAVYVDEAPVSGPSRHVAFMLQKDLLLPWRTIIENVALGLEIRGVPRKERLEVGRRELARCHLEAFADCYPHQLSGGMRQRAALARTLAVDPDVILLDEPFSAVDAQTRMKLQNDLAETLSEAGKTALFITHDLAEAVVLSDRVMVMSDRPGTIIREIEIDMPDRERPFARRQNQKMHSYVGELGELLHLDQSGDETPAQQPIPC